LGITSHGCVTQCVFDPSSKQEWEAFESILLHTQASRVDKNEGSIPAILKEKRKKFGVMIVVGEDTSMKKRATSSPPPAPTDR
jgi:hypothetical protein